MERNEHHHLMVLPVGGSVTLDKTAEVRDFILLSVMKGHCAKLIVDHINISFYSFFFQTPYGL